jgi:hypothetical protein
MFVITAHPKFFEMVDIMDVLYSPNSYHIPASYLESLPEDRVPVILRTNNRMTYHVGYMRPEKVSSPDLGLVQVYQGFNNPELYYGYDEVYSDRNRFVRYDEDMPVVDDTIYEYKVVNESRPLPENTLCSLTSSPIDYECKYRMCSDSVSPHYFQGENSDLLKCPFHTNCDIAPTIFVNGGPNTLSMKLPIASDFLMSVMFNPSQFKPTL